MRLVADVEAVARQKPQRLVVEAGLGEDLLQPGDDLRRDGRAACSMAEVAVAGQEFDRPVLPGLEARRLAERHRGTRVYSLGVMVRSTSQALFSCSKMRATRDSILKAGCSWSSRIAPDRRADLVDRQLHPQFRGLVLDDEQQFVMRARQRLLRVEHAVEMQIVAIGHALRERHLRRLPAAGS